MNKVECDQTGQLGNYRSSLERKSNDTILLATSEVKLEQYAPDILPELGRPEEISIGVEPSERKAERNRVVNSSNAAEPKIVLSDRFEFADSGSDTEQHNLEDWVVHDLAKSGIAPETARQLGIKCVYEKEVYNLLGFRAVDQNGKPVDGYIFPFFDPGTGKPMLCLDGCRPFVRMKLRNQAVLPGGSAKYLSPVQAGQHAYILPCVHQAILTGASVVLTEGEKKCICATERGLPVIGLIGIWGWRDSSAGAGVNHDRLLPELSRYAQAGTTWKLIFDSDAVLPEKRHYFQLAAARLAKVLWGHGVSLGMVILPQHTIQQHVRI